MPVARYLLPILPCLQANSAILNTLLTLINERQFDNGSQRMPVGDLKSCSHSLFAAQHSLECHSYGLAVLQGD